MARRSYGSGSLWTATGKDGIERWYGRWWANGRRVKRALGPRETMTRPEAEAELGRLRAETVVAPAVSGRHTVADVATRYVAHLEATGRKPSTVASVRGHLKHWIEPYLGDRPVDKVAVEDVERLMKLMRDGKRPGGLKRKKPLAPATIRKTIGTLHALIGFAVKRGWASANPVARVELPKAPASSADIRFLTPAEVEAVARSATPGAYEHIDRAMFLTAAMTGLRQGELVALRWSDVDWPAARIRVRQNYVLGEFGTPKTRRSVRSVPMADQVGAALDGLHQAAGSPRDDVLVFADPHTGGPLAKRAILLRFRAALKAARLDDTHRFHDLRHTFGTRLAAAGFPIRAIQEFMGHVDIQTTQRYADYTPSAREAERINEAFTSEAPNASDVGAEDRAVTAA